MNPKFSLLFVAIVSVTFSSPGRAQDAQLVADNLEYSREFYSGVHLVAIATEPRSFAYDRYPDNGPERIRCDDGPFAREHGKPWLKSDDWGRTGKPVSKEIARRLDGWVKLVENAFNVAPPDVKLAEKREIDGRPGWLFEGRSENPKGMPTRLRFSKTPWDTNPSVLLHEFWGSFEIKGDKVVPATATNRVNLRFGYLVNNGDFELSERAWEDLHEPKGQDQKTLSPPTIGLKPKDEKGLTDRAQARWKDGDAGGAVADFTRALELNPKSVSLVYDRGIAKLQKNDLDGAIADLDRAIELNPKTSDYYNDRGLAKLRKKDNDGAIADFTKAVELDAKNALAYRNRALARKLKNDTDGALGDYNKAIELEPKNANAFNNRGDIKKAKGDLDGAIADFTKAIELNSDFQIAYKNRAEAKKAKGDAAGAAEDLKHAGQPEQEEAPPSKNDAAVSELITRGIQKGKRKDLNGAIADFTKAIQLDQKEAKGYANRAYARQLKKDVAGALADYNRALELDPQNADSYYARGNLKAENHDLNGAIADYDRTIELKPDHAHAYYNRAVAKKEKGDKAGSAADFTSAGKYEPSLAPAAPPTINTVSLLDGKFKIDIPSDFKRDPDDPKEPKTLAKFSHNGEGGAWGTVLRGTHGLTPEELEGYLKKRVDEYSKGFKWMPKDAHLVWLKKEIITIDGRPWADWSFVPALKNKKDWRNNPVYSRNLTTSYKGQLLEVNFTTNLTTDPALKDEIDHIMQSVHLEE